jgi:hypothetical protein
MGYIKRMKEGVSFHLSFMCTGDKPEERTPHVNFPWSIVQEASEEPICPFDRGGNALPPRKGWVPFVAFFPISPSGMNIEIWKARSDHRQMKDNDTGIVVHIPMGVLLLVRGDVVHAGGWKNDTMQEIPHGRLYVNRCTNIDGKFNKITKQMQRIYKAIEEPNWYRTSPKLLFSFT